MRVLLFGATGMVGQGVLRECLRAGDVESVQTVGRSPTGQLDPRLHEIVHRDLFDYSAIESSLQGFDACFFCLGVSSFRMSEADYSHLTYDLTLAAARTLARLNPQMTFVYVSGSGTDSSEQGRSMWARVKGKTENALKALPFRAVYLFRPGVIEPLHGVRSKTRLYHLLYQVLKPLMALLHAVAPSHIVTTEEVGRAMLAVARRGVANRAVVEQAEIGALCRGADGAAGTPPLTPRAG
ncbi:NAD-dependent epimerase/dehydratase family protein [Paraburkholderia phenazinium]|jgi:uncharacterized protein YbjT (DUF2867 family)|uniref:Uncharacterized conserved protein YbjT, contains NAD(P)-binding and DUF2867 domains n=1 Tax=Paraburkholderia phenazinium TaxID=60549 RepID=A0A1G7P5K7_9BURK|nr:NAD(P)H-binding protein [Paraburkholderia phenazinium]SDF81407.1 Uncharacterized conserved protein YbjT, contains NAD(P)-binding and DUF2867 domains [Paraburkholderia phenazinium]